MNTKLIDLYWDYIKKISALSTANASAYTEASAKELLNVLSADTMLSKAYTRTTTSLAVDCGSNTITSADLQIGVQTP